MKSPRTTLKLSTLVLGLAMLFGTSSAQAQTFNFYSWFRVTHHNFAFTSVSSIYQYRQYFLFGGSYMYGFAFTGRTTSGQNITVNVMGPGGNVIGSRIGDPEKNMMMDVVQAFRTNSNFNRLKLFNVERRYGSYTVTTNSTMRIQVASPRASSYTGTSGGLVELEVNGGHRDFYVESVIRRQGSCGGGPKDSRLSVLRNRKSFIVNRDTQLRSRYPASLAMAELFLEKALDSVGNTVLDVSGAVKLEEDAPHRDPYHVASGRCASTYLIDSYRYINIRTLRN